MKVIAVSHFRPGASIGSRTLIDAAQSAHKFEVRCATVSFAPPPPIPSLTRFECSYHKQLVLQDAEDGSLGKLEAFVDRLEFADDIIGVSIPVGVGGES